MKKNLNCAEVVSTLPLQYNLRAQLLKVPMPKSYPQRLWSAVQPLGNSIAQSSEKSSVERQSDALARCSGASLAEAVTNWR